MRTLPETGLSEVKNENIGAIRNLPENWPLHTLVLLTLAVRLLTLPRFVEGGDGLYFLRGVERYAMLELRPHRPGFPVYIWLGKFFSLLNPDPTQALHLLSVLASTLAIWPVALLAGSWRKTAGGNPTEVRLAAFTAGLIWALIPLSWLNGSEVYSDPLALSLALLVLWLCWRSFEDTLNPWRWLAAAAVVVGFMLGVRLSYAALLLPLFYAVWRHRQARPFHRLNLPLPLVALVGLSLPVGLWFGWQIWMEGPKVLDIITNRVATDYRVQDLGLANGGDGDPATRGIIARVANLFRIIVVYGFGGWWRDTPLVRLPIDGLMTLLLALGGWRLFRNLRSPAAVMALLWGVPYFLLSIFITHDINMARYTFPLVALACIVAGMGLPAQKLAQPVVLFGTMAALLVISGPLALEHRVSPPLGQRLADYANANLDPAKDVMLVSTNLHRDAFMNLFVYEKAPAIPSIGVNFANLAERVKILEEQGHTVYAAFRPTTAPADWKLVASLRQNRFMDSLMDTDKFLEVWVYRHEPLATTPG